ncbi:MAG: hypothetical protein H7221_04950 [Flavobacterium sp.]|nr:hypothetical protein [Flavobacterium sp.]
MKKTIILGLMLVGFAFAGFSQNISKNALGFRLGSNDGFGGEISYQRKLNTSNRLEFDLGFRNSNDINAFKLAGLYQWVMPIQKNFNWYVGLGGGVGSWSYNKNQYTNSGTFFFGAGDIGIEYNFDIPLQISLDFRPELYGNSTGYRNSNFGSDIGLGLRYRF